MPAEFSSMADALECALEVQKALKPSTHKLPEQHRMAFRTGVKLEEVVADNKRNYGGGAHMAARLEPMMDG
jgi:adenylate cyclase